MTNIYKSAKYEGKTVIEGNDPDNFYGSARVNTESLASLRNAINAAQRSGETVKFTEGEVDPKTAPTRQDVTIRTRDGTVWAHGQTLVNKIENTALKEAKIQEGLEKMSKG